MAPMTPAIVLRLPLPSRRTRRLLGALLVAACCVLSLSGSPPYPAGTPVRALGVVGRVLLVEIHGEVYPLVAETERAAREVDAFLWRVGQARPGYEYVPWPDVEAEEKAR